MTTEKNLGQGLLTTNVGAYTEGALQLRLQTEELLNKIQSHLSGYRFSIMQDEDGEIKTIKIPMGSQRCNEKGVQDIMQYLQAIINPSTVQGNFTIEGYDTYIFECREELNNMIFNNIDEYEMDEKNYNGVINFIIKLIEPFISRVIDNEERKSYAQTIKTTESATLQQNKGILPF